MKIDAELDMTARTPARPRQSVTPYLVAMGLVLVGAPLGTLATFPLVVAPYPPADWPAAVFSGTVVRCEKDARRSGKSDWAVVATAEGERRMPMDVHDQIPGRGDRVVKRAGEVTFDRSREGSAPDDWSTERVAEEPGDSLLAGFELLFVWFVGLNVAAWVVLTCLRLRRLSRGSS